MQRAVRLNCFDGTGDNARVIVETEVGAAHEIDCLLSILKSARAKRKASS